MRLCPNLVRLFLGNRTFSADPGGWSHNLHTQGGEQFAQQGRPARHFPPSPRPCARTSGGVKSRQPEGRRVPAPDQHVVVRFKASGPGWQIRMHHALREAAEL
ncbi:BrnA antitoxin family protein [Paracoccus acridae]|uniref:BrnA antitoxin family protein n=1 Tax=Paracoccus acridae TaxID=1795310 RepID=UPI0034D75FF2